MLVPLACLVPAGSTVPSCFRSAEVNGFENCMAKNTTRPPAQASTWREPVSVWSSTTVSAACLTGMRGSPVWRSLPASP